MPAIFSPKCFALSLKLQEIMFYVTGLSMHQSAQAEHSGVRYSTGLMTWKNPGHLGTRVLRSQDQAQYPRHRLPVATSPASSNQPTKSLTQGPVSKQYRRPPSTYDMRCRPTTGSLAPLAFIKLAIGQPIGEPSDPRHFRFLCEKTHLRKFLSVNHSGTAIGISVSTG